MSRYVDVHTHLTHDAFAAELDAVVERANQFGAIVVNGLEPVSNRKILELSKTYPQIWPALGIYPVNAVCHLLPLDFAHPTPVFAVEEEVAYIRSKATEIVAVGECGLDGYWLDQSTFTEQERILTLLAEIGKDFSIPLIVHSRKLELRTIELLAALQVERVDFHCFGGKVKYALQASAEHPNWCFSIPANARRSESFTKMLRQLPEEQILTETDAPYLSRVKGERSEPVDCMDTVAYWAELKGWTVEEARDKIWFNFLRLFGDSDAAKAKLARGPKQVGV
jgi:TatD DNase family protein